MRENLPNNKDKRDEIYDEVFGPDGILRTSRNETDFNEKGAKLLTKHFNFIKDNYEFMPAFLDRLLTNVLHPSWSNEVVPVSKLLSFYLKFGF